jgi:hypothetical protein
LIYVDELHEQTHDEQSQHDTCVELVDEIRNTVDERIHLWLLWKAVRTIRRIFRDEHRDPETGKTLWPVDPMKNIRWRRLFQRFHEAGKMSKKMKAAVREHLYKHKHKER